MQELFQKYHLELSDEELQKFEKFLEIFMAKNSQINLSAIRDKEGIIEKHFVDSIMLSAFVDLQSSSSGGETEGSSESVGIDTQNMDSSVVPPSEGHKIQVADMGSGGGFPGIPLAIVNPDAHFVLMDSVAKKVRCLDEFASDLELGNISTTTGRAEDIGQQESHREQYDFVTSRATAYFPTLLEYTIPLLKVGGIFAAYKLEDKEELKTTKKALHRLGAKILKVKNYTLADQKRTIVLIEKIQRTHLKYPRKVGIPLKDPII